MHEKLRGFLSIFSTVLRGTALTGLVVGLSLPALGQTGITTSPVAGATTVTPPGTTGATTTTGTPALFCTVPTSLPSSLGATTGTTSTVGATAGTTATGTSTTTAIPSVTSSLIPGVTGTTLSCGTLSGTQNLQNLSFTAEGVVPVDFVLSPTAMVLPNEVFTGVIAGTTQLRDVVTLSGNTMTISLFNVPVTAAFPTMLRTPATTVTPPGSLITELTMQVSNALLTDGTTPTMLFSGIVNPTSTTSSTSTAGSTAGTTVAGGTTPVAGGTTPVAGGLTPVAGGTTPVAGGTTPVAGGTTTSTTALAPNLFGNVSGNAGSVSLAFTTGGFTFPGLGTTPVTPNQAPFGLIGSNPNQSTMAAMLTVTVAGAFTFASPQNFVTINTPPTPAAFQTKGTGTATTGGTATTIGGTTGGI